MFVKLFCMWIYIYRNFLNFFCILYWKTGLMKWLSSKGAEWLLRNGRFKFCGMLFIFLSFVSLSPSIMTLPHFKHRKHVRAIAFLVRCFFLFKAVTRYTLDITKSLLLPPEMCGKNGNGRFWNLAAYCSHQPWSATHSSSSNSFCCFVFSSIITLIFTRTLATFKFDSVTS